jgi:hypothetical protein
MLATVVRAAMNFAYLDSASELWTLLPSNCFRGSAEVGEVGYFKSEED